MNGTLDASYFHGFSNINWKKNTPEITRAFNILRCKLFCYHELTSIGRQVAIHIERTQKYEL